MVRDLIDLNIEAKLYMFRKELIEERNSNFWIRNTKREGLSLSSFLAGEGRGRADY